MDAKCYWDMIYEAIENRGLSITEFAEAIGFKRETIYTQRRKGIIPGGEQVLAMQEYLGLVGNKVNKFDEYIPYIEKAEEWQIKAIREILRMPEKKSDAQLVG